MNNLIEIETLNSAMALRELSVPYYCIVLFDGEASFSLDFDEYACTGKTLLFLSPYQLLKWHSSNVSGIHLLKFHGDFYCIEYHKEEVACNGILFNNIYERPFVAIPGPIYNDITHAFRKIMELENSSKSYDLAVMKSYLQLILALSSKEKQTDLMPNPKSKHPKNQISGFNSLLDEHFVEAKLVSFYAAQYGLSVDTFSKKIKRYFGKTPSKLIQERLTLEAKKLLHLTYKSIKEIARELGFEDEFYFSRYFKNEVGVSPKTFRESVGISIAAK